MDLGRSGDSGLFFGLIVTEGFGRKIYCIQQLGHYFITIHEDSLFVHHANVSAVSPSGALLAHSRNSHSETGRAGIVSARTDHQSTVMKNERFLR